MIETGTRLPYLYTHHSTLVRSFVVFPLLLGTLSYFGLVKKQSGGRTGFQKALSATHGVGRLRFMVFSGGGMLLSPGLVAWTSIAFPAYLALWLASDRFVQAYEIRSIVVRSGSVWTTLYDLELHSGDTGQDGDLRLSRSQYKQDHWNVGDRICVIGRRSAFGTIVDDVTRDERRCARG